MSECRIDLLRVLAAGGQPADDVAAAIPLLVKKGAELGALEPYQVADPDRPGELVTKRGIPRIWLQRLARAVEVGAFDRLDVEEIVDRILAPPLPDHVES